MEETAQYFEISFFSLFQNSMQHIEIMKFCQNHCSPVFHGTVHEERPSFGMIALIY